MENNLNSATTNSEAVAVAQILSRQRQVVSAYGEFYGKQLFTITAYNPDLKWKDDVQNDKNTLRKEVNIFVVRAIDVRSLELVPNYLGSGARIIINEKDGDPTLVFPVVPPSFKEATRENVQVCIDEYLRTKSPNGIFFSASQLPQLNSLLKIANQATLTFYEDLSRKYMQLSGTVRGVMDTAERAQTEYLRQCGVGKEEVEARVKIEITE